VKKFTLAKNKLKKFNDIKAYKNVFEPSIEDLKKHYSLSGKWNELVFKNNNPIVLELGCGMGEYSVGLAIKYPNKNFIGIDVKGARMWQGATQAIDQELTNVCFLRTRIEFIEHCFVANEIDEIWITFPDPQIKKRRARKRLTHPFFLEKYRHFLCPNGQIHLKTDSQFLYGYTLGIIEGHNHILEDADHDIYNAKLKRENLGIKTHYEKMFLNKGMEITYLRFRLNLNEGTTFFEKVYQVARQVPIGKVTTYGAIGKYLGSPRSARMVGWALNKSSLKNVPAHKVVNKQGLLTGKFHFDSITLMEQLLENEGIAVIDNQIQDMEKHFWDPNKELS
jgi:tRNA (guanine-N7-)-methyltransferase